MRTFHHYYQLLALLLLQVPPHLCHLHCDYADSSLETLKCRSFTHKVNNISPKIEIDDEDTTLTDFFRKYNWRRIKSMVLSDANMGNIHSDLFANASSLVSLDVSENERADLDEGSFDYLKKLKSLSVSLTMMDKISPSKLSNLNCLSIDYRHPLSPLTATYNKNRPLDPITMYMWRRQHVNMVKNVFQKIISTRIETLFLKYLLLDFTEIEINPGIISLNVIQSEVKLGDGCFEKAKGLRLLRISHSGLSEIPKDTFRGAKIAYLDLSHNSLTPVALTNLTSGMKSVKLSHNKITHTDYMVNGLPSSLEIFDLSHNTLSQLDGLTFAKTPKLISLDLSNNQLTVMLINVFLNLSELILLDLSNNFISHLSYYWFMDLLKLNTLNLSGNRLQNLNDNLFRRNADLSVLLLSYNELDDLRMSTFNHFFIQNLREVDVSNNKLTQLPRDFVSLETLTWLSLSCNRISHYSVGDVRSHGHLFIRGNPWKCGCLPKLLEDPRNSDTHQLTDGYHPSCYSGLESNYSNVCDDTPLSEEDYERWERATRNSGQC